MGESEANDIRPQQRLSFPFKVAIGLIACAGLYAVVAPSPPTKPDQSQQAEVPANKPEVRSGQYVMKGTRVHMTETAPACSKLDDLSKFRELATEGDKEAVIKMVARGDCELLDKGSTVTVQDSSVWRGAECVRPAGDTDCLWTLTRLTDGHLD